jgi:hypothetical protein
MGIKSTWESLKPPQRAGVIIALTVPFIFFLIFGCCFFGGIASFLGRKSPSSSTGSHGSNTSAEPMGARTSDETHGSNDSALSVGSSQLVSEYMGNEVAADDKYKGSRIGVSGNVTKIGKSLLDSPYVVLGSADPLRQVHCSFDDDKKSGLAQLQIGSYVTIVGTCKGLSIDVQLDDCRLSGSH